MELSSPMFCPCYESHPILMVCELPSYAPATGLKCSEWWTWNHFGISNSLSNQLLDFFLDSWLLLHGRFMSSRYPRNGKSRVKEGMVVRGYLKTWTYRSVFEVIISFFWTIWTTKLGSKWAGVSKASLKAWKKLFGQEIVFGIFSSQSSSSGSSTFFHHHLWQVPLVVQQYLAQVAAQRAAKVDGWIWSLTPAKI